MKVIVCLDKNGGMLFNRRRQSRDRYLIDDLERHLQGAPLRMAPYSQSLFLQNKISCVVSEDPLADAGAEDYCFIEDRALSPYQDSITEVILYHWNRHYPADLVFDLDMSAFKRISTADFPGFSHEKITKEVWKK